MRSRFRIFEEEYPYFLTCTIVHWLPLFIRPWCAEVVLNSFAFLHNHSRWSLLGYVVMENHVHFISMGEKLSDAMGDFKSYTACRIIVGLESRNEVPILQEFQRRKQSHRTDREFQVWQEGSHPQQLTDERMINQKLEYIHNNPVRRGYVDRSIGGIQVPEITKDWKAWYPSRRIGNKRYD